MSVTVEQVAEFKLSGQAHSDNLGCEAGGEASSLCLMLILEASHEPLRTARVVQHACPAMVPKLTRTTFCKQRQKWGQHLNMRALEQRPEVLTCAAARAMVAI